MKPVITFEDFAKIDLRIGKIVQAEEVETSKKLLKVMVDVGGETRQLLAGIKGHYVAGDLVGKSVVVVANLAPRTMMGLESQGMILAANHGEVPTLVMPINEVPAGTIVK